jgi:tRNA-specific 2-thiouridylase
MCNKEVKFGAFYRFARERGADFVATGHYAQTIRTDGGVAMHRGIDTNKDQTYFLWTLPTEILEHVLFPVGDSTKDIIRAEAAQAGLLTAEKKDSQGVCFLGHIDIPDFLSHYIDLKEGDVLNEQGAVIGKHRGAFVYTIGQRQGFTLHDTNPNRAALYVVAKDTHANTITVARTQPQLQTHDTLRLLQSVLTQKVTVGDTLEAQSRYRQKPFSVIVKNISDTELTLEVQNQSEATAVGQSCVLYRGEVCIGGGIIS